MAQGGSSYSILAQLFGLSNVTSGFQKISAAAQQSTARITSSVNAQNRAFASQHSQLARYGHSFTRFYGGEGMFRARDIIKRNLDSLKDYAEEAQKLAQAQFQFRVIGLDEGENQKAFGAVAETVKNLKGLRLDEVTRSATDLHTAFGNLDHALEHLEQASKFSFGFSTMMGDKFTPEVIEEQIQKGYKFLELTGVVSQGKEAVEKQFDVLVQMGAATGGRVTPAEMLLMARKGGAALKGLSAEGLRSLSAPVQELGGAASGTGLSSIYGALAGGKMPMYSAKEWQRLGLLKPKGAIKFTSAGLLAQIGKGAFKDSLDAFQEDPAKFGAMINQAMEKLGIKDPKKKREELQKLFTNKMANRLMDIYVMQPGQVEKERALSRGAKDTKGMYDLALDTPMGKMKQFENAVANLKVTIGGPLLNAASTAAEKLLPLIKITASHPQVTLFTGAIIKLGLALLKMRMGYMMYGGGFGGGGGISGGSGALSPQQQWAGLFKAAPAAGVSTGMRVGQGILTGIGTVGAGYVLERFISGQLESSEANDAAATAGERLGALLMDGMKSEIEGKLSPALQAEAEKAGRPEIAKAEVESLQIGRTKSKVGTFGQPSEMATDLARATGLGTYLKKDYGWFTKQAVTESGKEVEERIKNKVGALQFTKPERMQAFLGESKKALASEPELYGTLEKLTRETYPALAAQMDAQKAGLTAATGSVEAFSDALRRAAAGIPINPLGQLTPGFAPPLGKGPLFGGPRPFIQHGPGSILHPSAYRGAGATVHAPVTIAVHITGDPTEAQLAKLKAHIKDSGQGIAKEISRHLDDRGRDREMMA